MENKRYPKDYFVGLGVAIGIPVGMPIGLAIGNLALGPAFGVVIGLVIGYILENKYNKDPLPLDPKIEKRRKTALSLVLVLGFAVLLIAAIQLLK